MSCRFHSAILVLALGASASAAQEDAPSLPRLAIELFPPPARASVERADPVASARAKDPEAVSTLACVLHAWDQWDAAHAVYTRAQALAPRAFEWYYLDGVVLQRLVRHAEAAARFRQAVALAPAYAPARAKLADALFETGSLDESRRLSEELVGNPATEPMGQFILGRVAAAERRHDVAVEHLGRAVALFPQWGAAHYALALSYRRLGRHDDARQALERHAQYGSLWPRLADEVLDRLTAIRDDGRALLARGIKLADAGDLAGAIAAHEAALAQDATLAQAHRNLISLYGRTGQWVRAEAHYRTLLNGADVGDAHYDYGVLLGLQQRWDEAADVYRLAIASNPLHATAYNNLGEILERQRNLGDALGAYRQAVASQPGFRLARFNFARILLATGRTEQAVGELSRLVEPRDAEAPRFLFALAVAHARAGQKDESVKWATDARQLAVKHGQSQLAADIARELAKLK